MAHTMGKMSKRIRALASLYDKELLYKSDEAAEIAKKTATAKFDETIEIALKVNIKKGQSIRDTIVLPHQVSKEKKILVFARGEKAEQAEKAGASFVGDLDLIEKIKGGWSDFDVVIATPDMMKDVGKLGPVLGRRGLMPNPKTKTVTMEVEQAIKELQKGRLEIRADKTGVVHLTVGKSSMDSSQISENIDAVIREVQTKKPAETKGDFVLSVAISSSMGPGIKLNIG